MKPLISVVYILLYILLPQVTYCQSSDTILKDSINRIENVQTMPQYPGGMQALHKLIRDSLVYPDEALAMRVGGKVMVRFIVDTLGNATEISIIQGVRWDIDAEAIRIVGLLNGWTPGIQNGKKVKTIYSLPIIFAPDKKWRREYDKTINK